MSPHNSGPNVASLGENKCPTFSFHFQSTGLSYTSVKDLKLRAQFQQNPPVPPSSHPLHFSPDKDRELENVMMGMMMGFWWDPVADVGWEITTILSIPEKTGKDKRESLEETKGRRINDRVRLPV